MKKLSGCLGVLVLVIAINSTSPPASAAGARPLRISVQSTTFEPSAYFAKVTFTFTGRGCRVVDLTADIDNGPSPAAMEPIVDRTYGASVLSAYDIGAPDGSSITVAGWYERTDTAQDVTATGTVQCEEFGHENEMKSVSRTATVPPAAPSPPDPPPPGSWLRPGVKDSLDASAYSSGAAGVAFCAGSFIPGGQELIPLCVGTLGVGAGSAAASMADPPDPRFQNLVPSHFPTSRFRTKVVPLVNCAALAHQAGRRCAAINRAYVHWTYDSRELSWLSLATAVSANREKLARTRLTGAALTRVVDLHRVAIALYVGRFAQVFQHRAPLSRRLARITRGQPFDVNLSLRDRAHALAELANGSLAPRHLARQFKSLHLPYAQTMKHLATLLHPRDVPSRLSEAFARLTHQPRAAADLLQGAPGDPAAAWPGSGVVGVLVSLLNGHEELLGACDDPGLGTTDFRSGLDRLEARLGQEHPVIYGRVLARTLLDATRHVRLSCPTDTPSATIDQAVPTVAAPSTGDSFVGATDLDVAPDGSIVVADPDERTVTRYPVDGSAPVVLAGPTVLQTPTDVAVDANGDVYVSDFDAMTVVHLTASGNLIGTIGSFGAGPGQFDRPAGLAIGPDGSVVVCDAKNTRLEQFAPDGTLVKVIQSPAPGQPGHLLAPRGIAVSADGTIAVADRNDAAVVLFRLSDGAYLGTTPPTEELGLPSPIGLYQPYAVRFDPRGNLWVADRGGGQIVQLTGLGTTGRVITAFGYPTSLGVEPTALAFRSGHLDILDHGMQQVLEVPQP